MILRHIIHRIPLLALCFCWLLRKALPLSLARFSIQKIFPHVDFCAVILFLFLSLLPLIMLRIQIDLTSRMGKIRNFLSAFALILFRSSWIKNFFIFRRLHLPLIIIIVIMNVLAIKRRKEESEWKSIEKLFKLVITVNPKNVMPKKKEIRND